MAAFHPTHYSSAASRLVLTLVLVFAGLAGSQAAAQVRTSVENPSVLGTAAQVAKDVVTDPTTYAPTAIFYTSMRLDWDSSQPLFRQGFVEDNPRYTRNGLPHDLPISYGEGNRQILKDSLALLPTMAVNNVAARFGERALVARFPDHPRLIHALGWIERVSFSAYLSYQFSSRHFAQWRQNQRLENSLGPQ
jgi:hypothetical protein